MKSILMLAAGLLAWPFLSSCSEYGSTYGYSSGGGYNSSSYGYSSGYAPLQVGFISTSYDRWSYDPYRRCYYDRSLGRYYNYSSRSYYTSSPRRYSSPYYPSGYRHGQELSCPTYLPRHSSSGHVSHGSSSYGQSHDYGNRGSSYGNQGNYGSSQNNSRYSTTPTIIRSQPSSYDRQRQDESSRRSGGVQIPRQQVEAPRLETIRTPSRPVESPRIEAPRMEERRIESPRIESPRPSARSEIAPPPSHSGGGSEGPSRRGGGEARQRVR